MLSAYQLIAFNSSNVNPWMPLPEDADEDEDADDEDLWFYFAKCNTACLSNSLSNQAAWLDKVVGKVKAKASTGRWGRCTCTHMQFQDQNSSMQMTFFFFFNSHAEIIHSPPEKC